MEKSIPQTAFPEYKSVILPSLPLIAGGVAQPNSLQAFVRGFTQMKSKKLAFFRALFILSLNLQIKSIYCLMPIYEIQEENKKINRLKIVLAEQDKTGKWLAEKLQKNEATISRWCSNTSQPSLEMLVNIATVLDVDARNLIVQTK